jgi:hypothetical protein
MFKRNTTDVFSGRLRVWHSAPELAPQIELEVDSDWLLLRDVDGDGQLDIFTQRGIYSGFGDGTFAALKPFPKDHPLAYRTLGDIDEDGHLDLVGLKPNDLGESTVGILKGVGDATFSEAEHALPTLNGHSDAALADFNDDTHLDLAILVRGEIHLLIGAGDGTFPCTFVYPVHTDASGISAVDIDHDDRVDIVASVPTAQLVSVLRNMAIEEGCR